MFEAFLFLFYFSFLDLGVFHKTMIPLALVGCEMIIANEAHISTISYPTRAREIIVK